MVYPWLVPVALLFGAIVGAGLVGVVLVADRRGRSAASVINESVPDGVYQVLEALDSAGLVVDPSNNVLGASPGALALGLVWDRALVHDELITLVDTARRSGEPTTRDLQLARGPFGEAVIHLRARAARLGTRYMLLLADDATESRRLEEVRRDFVANISHELKTPIGAIGLLAEALESAADEPAQVRRFSGRLTVEAQRLSRVTQEVIELSRLQATDALADPVEVEVDAVIAEAVEQNRVLAESRSVTLAKGAPPGARVLGDRALLVMAVHNLVSNAVRYSPDGGRVGVGVTVDGGVVEIAVADQGIGIPVEDLDRVFERFFRVDQARSRDTGGTGLGLSIVKHIVQNHGGDIRVWSQPGRGSTFTIRLPEASHATLPAGSVSPAVPQGEQQ